MIKTLILTLLAGSVAFAGESSYKSSLQNAGPLTAEAGKCYTHVVYPARYKYEKVKVMTQEASSRFEHVPAKYEYAMERRMVKEGREEIRVIPATYREVREKILLKPAATKIVNIPAKYGYKEMKVLVKDRETQWKKGRSLISHKTEDEIVCAEEKPEVYKMVRQKILVEPARIAKQEIPEEWGYVTKKVVDQQARIERIKIPAVYKDVKVRRLVKDAYEREIQIPAEYGYVKKKVQTRQSFTKWEEVVCASNINSLMVLKLQKGLNKKGYRLAEDGMLGDDTKQAISDYQRRRGLPRAYLTMGTLKSLGID